MTVTRLKAAFDRALSHAKVTTRDVAAFDAAVRDGKGINAREAAALRAFLQRYGDRFEPAATTRMDALLSQLPAPGVGPAPTPSAVNWDDFSVPPTRAAVTGTQREEGLATFDQLSSAVSSGALTPADQLLLAGAAARVGIMGEAQAVRAVKRHQALGDVDRRGFDSLADQARSPLERAFLWKALGAGTPLPELATFAGTIKGWSNARLLQTLDLADAVLDDRKQTGLVQQFNGSCVVTTAELLRGEVDPVYALAVRTQNTDVHRADEHDAFKVNPALAKDQGAELDHAGGYPTPRVQGGVGIKQTAIDGVYDARAAQTGYTFKLLPVDQDPGTTVDTLLDTLSAQLEQGIPTPLLVGDQLSSRRHALLALEVRGSGDDQRFLLHDPWSGNTLEVTRAQFRSSSVPLGDFDRLGAIHVATPVP